MKNLLPMLFLLALPAPALAADGSGGLLLPGLKMLGGLALVLGLFYLLYAASRKGLGFMPGARDSLIKIVEVRSLGARKGLCLVQVRGQELLLGFGPERIDCLARLEPGPGESDFARQLEIARGGEEA